MGQNELEQLICPPSSVFSERLAKQILCRLYINKTAAN